MNQRNTANPPDIIAYTTAGKPLSRSQYEEQIQIGLRQIEQGQTLSDEEMSNEIITW
jgi:predicted transcriptional regulator